MFIQVHYLLLLKCLRLMHLRLLLGGVTIITLILQEFRCIWLWLERPILSTSKKTTCTWELKKTTLSVSVLPFQSIIIWIHVCESKVFTKQIHFTLSFLVLVPGMQQKRRLSDTPHSIHSWIFLDPMALSTASGVRGLWGLLTLSCPKTSRLLTTKSPKCFTNYFPWNFW